MILVHTFVGSPYLGKVPDLHLGPKRSWNMDIARSFRAWKLVDSFKTPARLLELLVKSFFLRVVSKVSAAQRWAVNQMSARIWPERRTLILQPGPAFQEVLSLNLQQPKPSKREGHRSHARASLGSATVLGRPQPVVNSMRILLRALSTSVRESALRPGALSGRLRGRLLHKRPARLRPARLGPGLGPGRALAGQCGRSLIAR